jgi:hypothetical protein
MAQVFVESGRRRLRSDDLLKGADSLLTQGVQKRLRYPPSLLSKNEIVALTQDVETSSIEGCLLKPFHLTD